MKAERKGDLYNNNYNNNDGGGDDDDDDDDECVCARERGNCVRAPN